MVPVGRELAWARFLNAPTDFPAFVNRLLIVDDCAGYRALVKAWLSRKGVDVLEAAGTADALRLAKAQRPDLIVVDWVLKREDGLETIASLRTCAATNDIPLVLISSVVQDADGPDAVAAGADLFMVKHDFERLIKGAPVRKPAAGKVVVIDDDPGARELAGFALAEKGFDVTFAENGKQGYLAVRRERPALVILDLTLPGMNGSEVLKLLGSDAMSKDIPVIVTTALADGGGVVKSFVESMSGASLLAKPFSVEQLQELVGRLLGVSKALAPEEQVLERGRVRLAPARGKAWVEGREIELGPKRLVLLKILLSHPGAVSIEQILAEGWPDGQDPNTITKTVNRLRDDLALPDLIVSTRSGYRLLG